MPVFDFDVDIDLRAVGSMKWDASRGDQLPMGIADMDLSTAPAVVDALRRRVERGVFGYTDVQPGLLQAICEWTAGRRGWTLDPEWITPCSGVMPSITHLLRSALDTGDGVIVQTPAFGPIVNAVQDNDLRLIENRLELIDGRYQMDLDRFRVEAARPDAKAFVLCSPHNPSGRVWAHDELAAIADIARAHDLIVISDEIHGEVIFPWADFTTYGTVARDEDPFAVCFGPSKGFNLATLHTSLTAIPHVGLRASFRDELHKVNADFGVGALGAVAVQTAYTDGAKWLDALTTHLEENLHVLTEGLADVPEIAAVRPDASFLVWLDCRGLGLSDDELLDRFVNVAGVIVEPGTSFGPAGSGFVRINIGTTRARVLEASERIARTLRR